MHIVYFWLLSWASPFLRGRFLVRVRVFVRFLVRVRVFVRVFLYECLFSCTSECLHVFVHVFLYECVFSCVFSCMCAYLRVCFLLWVRVLWTHACFLSCMFSFYFYKFPAQFQLFQFQRAGRHPIWQGALRMLSQALNRSVCDADMVYAMCVRLLENRIHDRGNTHR